MAKQIIVEFDDDGNPRIEGQGFVGTECDKFLKEVSDALGEKVSEQPKPEYAARIPNRGREGLRGSR